MRDVINSDSRHSNETRRQTRDVMTTRVTLVHWVLGMERCGRDDVGGGR